MFFHSIGAGCYDMYMFMYIYTHTHMYQQVSHVSASFSGQNTISHGIA